MRLEVLLAAAAVFAAAADGAIDIRTPPEPPNDVRFAAEDLRWHLNEMTDGRGDIAIEVGTERAKEKALAAAGSLKDGESAAVGDGSCVYIWGAGQMGTANGVYRYLERNLGCRWLTAWDHPYVPKRASLTAGRFSDVNRPGLSVRWLLTAMGSAQLPRNGSLFLHRNRGNCDNWKVSGNVDLPKGCRPLEKEVYCVPPMVHSMFWYVSNTNFEQHADWFSMDHDGKRKRNMQYCFSSKELRAEYVRAFLAHVGKCGGRGVFDLSQTDEHGDGFCWCPACTALTERYGTPAAPLLDFLKELGPAVKAKFPESRIKFLCYRKTQTQIPPNAAFGRLPDNVIPVVAPIDDDFSKDLTAPANAGTLTDFKRWRAIADAGVWVWYYPLPYGGNGAPFSSIGRWSADLEMLFDAGLTGGQFEHDVGYSTGLNTADLQAWLILKKYEHPHADAGRLMREFCRCHYGAAAGEAVAYVEDLERITREYPKFLVWNSFIPSALNVPNLLKWNALFARAEAKVKDDPVLLQHVRELRAGLDLYTLKRFEQLRKGGFGEAAKEVYGRLSDTLAKAYERRAPGKAKEAVFCPPKGAFKKLNERAKLLFELANGGMKPLPPHLAKVPEEDLVQLFNSGGGSNASGKSEQVEMADAASGRATTNDGDSRDPKGFHVGYYDRANGKFGESIHLKREDMAEGEFRFYRVGEVVPSQCGYVFIGQSCLVRTYLDECYEPAVPVKWDLWISLKFDGEKVWYDRLVLVRKRDAK